jgi:ABC-type Zn uptake system ZnuABC Zn-binding protein ZnuA
MYRLYRLVLPGLLALLLVGCGQTSPAAPSGRLTVLTSTTVLADLIRNVTGEAADVVSLVPAGGNPFEYEPSPADAITVSTAGVVFVNGLQHEAFLGKLLENAGSSSRRVVTLSDGLETITSSIDHGDHGHLFPNSYLFLNVRNAMAYVGKIRDTLSEVDSRNAVTYRANAERYLAELGQLDSWIMGEIARIPESRRRLMKDHDAFPYYAARYGLANFAASYEGTAEVAPSPSQYATLIGQVEKFKIAALFGEVGFGSKLLQQLAQDTGARYVPGLHAATLGTTEETDSYVKMMRWNTRLIVENLQ